MGPVKEGISTNQLARLIPNRAERRYKPSNHDATKMTHMKRKLLAKRRKRR